MNLLRNVWNLLCSFFTNAQSENVISPSFEGLEARALMSVTVVETDLGELLIEGTESRDVISVDVTATADGDAHVAIRSGDTTLITKMTYTDSLRVDTMKGNDTVIFNIFGPVTKPINIHMGDGKDRLKVFGAGTANPYQSAIVTADLGAGNDRAIAQIDSSTIIRAGDGNDTVIVRSTFRDDSLWSYVDGEGGEDRLRLNVNGQLEGGPGNDDLRVGRVGWSYVSDWNGENNLRSMAEFTSFSVGGDSLNRIFGGSGDNDCIYYDGDLSVIKIAKSIERFYDISTDEDGGNGKG